MRPPWSRASLRAVRPQLAAQLDEDAQVSLVDENMGEVLGGLVRLAEKVQVLAPVLLLVTVLLVGGAIALSPDRRRTATELGVAAAAVGVLVVLVNALGRGAVLGAFDDPSGRDAAAAVWEAFLGDLRRAGWVLAVLGAVIAASAASLIRPVEIDEPLRRLGRAFVRQPEATWARVVRALGLVVAGVVVLVDRAAVLQLLFTLVGAYLVYAGLAEILRLVYRPAPEGEPEPAPRRRRGRRWAVVAIAALVVGGSVAAFASTGGTSAPAAEPVDDCNGSAELCDRPLAEVVLPATHNSMSAPLPGWYSAEQEKGIPGQLDAGVRGLLIDTHYADELSDGKVRTEFGSREELRRQAEEDGISEDAIDAALRIRDRLGFAGRGQARDVPLPHLLRAGRHVARRGARADQRIHGRPPGRGARGDQPGLRGAGRLRRGGREGGPRRPGVRRPGDRRAANAARDGGLGAADPVPRGERGGRGAVVPAGIRGPHGGDAV